MLVEPDGTTGSYILFDKTTLQPLAVVNQAGQQVNINNGIVIYQRQPLSPELQKLINDVFTQKFASTDTKSTQTAQTDTFNPELITGLTIKTSSGATATPIFLVTNPGDSSIPTPQNGPLNLLSHVPQAPTVTPVGDVTKEIPLTTGSKTLDFTFNKISFTDINQGDRPTVSTSFNDFTFADAQGHDLTALVKNNPKYAHWFADIKATEVDLVVTPDPSNTNNGSATWVYNVADSAFDFLAAGEKLTLTYNAVVDNNFTADPTTEKATQTFTIIITGTNDVPVITTGPEFVAFFGGKGTTGGKLPTVTPGAPTSGTLAFTDVDLTDTHTVKSPLTSAVLSGSTAVDGPIADFETAFPLPAQFFEQALIASVTTDSTGIGTGVITWNLADIPAYLADFIPNGQTLTLTYTVTVVGLAGRDFLSERHCHDYRQRQSRRGLDLQHDRPIAGRPTARVVEDPAELGDRNGPNCDQRRHHHHRPVARAHSGLSRPRSGLPGHDRCDYAGCRQFGDDERFRSRQPGAPEAGAGHSNRRLADHRYHAFPQRRFDPP